MPLRGMKQYLPLIIVGLWKVWFYWCCIPQFDTRQSFWRRIRWFIQRLAHPSVPARIYAKRQGNCPIVCRIHRISTSQRCGEPSLKSVSFFVRVQRWTLDVHIKGSWESHIYLGHWGAWLCLSTFSMVRISSSLDWRARSSPLTRARWAASGNWISTTATSWSAVSTRRYSTHLSV